MSPKTQLSGETTIITVVSTVRHSSPRRWEGSSEVAVSNCEMFDPDSDSWSVMDMPPIGGGGGGSVKLFVVPKSVEEVDDR